VKRGHPFFIAAGLLGKESDFLISQGALTTAPARLRPFYQAAGSGAGMLKSGIEAYDPNSVAPSARIPLFHE
jgi:hypothetical protein